MLETLRSLRERARDRLDPRAFAYLEYPGDEGDEPDPFEQAWNQHPLLPHVLRDVGTVDTSIELLGRPLGAPLLVAPTGYHAAFHPDAELATARGVAAANGLYVVSSRSTRRFEQIRDTGVEWWLQVYLMGDRRLTALLVERAVACGARALMLTGDTPRLGGQARWGDVVGGAPGRLANLTAADTGGRFDPADLPPSASTQDAATTLDDVRWLAELSGLPVLVKGVLRADDTAACLDAGAAGVVVSNHGGRQLRTQATAHRVAPVAAATRKHAGRGAAAPVVLVDGGVRDGTAALTALALGADAVLVGRPVLWGLAAAGADGVAEVLTALTADLELALALAGLTTPVQADATLLA